MTSYLERRPVNQVDVDGRDIDTAHINYRHRCFDGVCWTENDSPRICDAEAYFLGLQYVILHNEDVERFEQFFAGCDGHGGSAVADGSANISQSPMPAFGWTAIPHHTTKMVVALPFTYAPAAKTNVRNGSKADSTDCRPASDEGGLLLSVK